MTSHGQHRSLGRKDLTTTHGYLNEQTVNLDHDRRIMGEIRDLVKNPTDGIRYVENDEDTVSEIHAVLDGPG